MPRCCPETQTHTAKRASARSAAITGNSLIASGRVPKTTRTRIAPTGGKLPTRPGPGWSVKSLLHPIPIEDRPDWINLSMLDPQQCVDQRGGKRRLGAGDRAGEHPLESLA